jgi:hypothetical protein
MLAATIHISARTLKKKQIFISICHNPISVFFLTDLRIVGFRLVWLVLLTYSRYIVFYVGFFKLFDTHLHYKRDIVVCICVIIRVPREVSVIARKYIILI